MKIKVTFEKTFDILDFFDVEDLPYLEDKKYDFHTVLTTYLYDLPEVIFDELKYEKIEE